MSLIQEIYNFGLDFGQLISIQPTTIKVILTINLVFVLYVVMEKNIKTWKEIRYMISN